MSATAIVMRPARAAAPLEQTWDLEGLYPDLAAWEADLSQVDALIAGLAAYRGRLGTSARELLACLLLQDHISQTAHRVSWYASNRLSEDQADPARQELNSR